MAYDAKNLNVPPTKGEVQQKLLKFKQGGPSVEEARAAMLTAKEPASTLRGGVRVPKFVEEGRGQGGNVPVHAAVQKHAELLMSARQKLANLRIPQGTRLDLNKMRENGMITQEEIDALLRDKKQEAPKEEPSVVVTDIVEDAPEPEAIIPERVPAEPVVVPPPAPQVEDADGDKTVIEDNKHFTVYWGREGRDWVAELVYKNGAGTERFIAPSVKELSKKLAVGKANASVKVRKMKEQAALGDSPDTWDFFFHIMKEEHGITEEQFSALPEASRDAIQDTIQTQQAIAFREESPEYYNTARNWQSLQKYLGSRKWPLTYRNLVLAYQALSDDDLLEVRPASNAPQATPAAALQVSAPTSTAAPADSGAAVVSPAPAVQPAPAEIPSVPVVRKRAVTGLVPGSSSAAPSAPVRTEAETKSPEPSVDELKTMSMSDLKRIATKDRKYGVRY